MLDEVSAMEELEWRRMYGKPPDRQLHPQRCATCYYPHQMKDESGEWKRCPIAKCELSFERLSLIDVVGCASHSATHT
jgi:protein-arginine kinase activator protein McsA